MQNQDLVNYISQAKLEGESDQRIKEDLLKAGWTQVDIDNSFSFITNPTNQPLTNLATNTSVVSLYMKYISIFVVVTIVLGGGLFFYSKYYKKAIIAEVASPSQNTDMQDSTTPVANEYPNDPARVAAIEKLQTFLVDWQNKYKTACVGKETNDECVVWIKGIEKLKSDCFQNNLSGAEVTKCGEDILDKAFQSALWSKATEAAIPTTKSTIDSHGIDLAKLPEGQTVKVFKNGPTEEVSYGNETTVTYVRTGDSVTVTEVIVFDGNLGHTQYTQTVSLK
jgi:hypothetical protein